MNTISEYACNNDVIARNGSIISTLTDISSAKHVLAHCWNKIVQLWWHMSQGWIGEGGGGVTE